MQDENRIDFTSKQLLRTSSWKKIQNIKNLTKSMIKSNSQILTITSAPRNEFPIASLRDISDKQSTLMISIGINSPKTHPSNLKFNYINKQKLKINDIVGTHSELSAVIKLGNENCKGLTIVNTRVNRNNEIDNSCPCNGCRDMIKKLGFKKLVYTTKQQKFKDQKQQKNKI